MNIVQMHHKTVFFLDSVNSPRFTNHKKDEAINTAILDIVLDRYNNIREKEKQYAFQTSQRLRDELYTIVKHPSYINASGGIIPKTGFPSDYMLLLAMKADISGQWINTIPVTYDEYNMLELNPYTFPSIDYPERIYRIENSEGLEVMFGEQGQLIRADIFYMAKPAVIDIGTEVIIGESVAVAEGSVIAYTDVTMRTGPAITLLTLKKGEKYVVGTNSEQFITLDSGVLYKSSIDCDLPEMLHDEVCRKAADILSGNVENYNRSQALKQDVENTNN